MLKLENWMCVSGVFTKPVTYVENKDKLHYTYHYAALQWLYPSQVGGHLDCAISNQPLSQLLPRQPFLSTPTQTQTHNHLQHGLYTYILANVSSHLVNSSLSLFCSLACKYCMTGCELKPVNQTVNQSLTSSKFR